MPDPKRWMAPLLALVLAGGPLAAEPLRLLTSDIPPFSFETGGQPRGLAVDLIFEAFRRLNQPVELEFVPFARAVERVRAGTADGIFPFVVSEERRGFTDYSKEPVLMDPLSLFVRADSDLRFDGDYSQLSGKTIGMVRGSNQGPEFMSALERYHIAVDLAEDGERNILKLVGGRFDIIVGPLLSVRYEAKELGKASEIKVLYQNVTKGPAFLGLSKHSRKTALLARFDAVMRQIREDGTYDAVLQRYR